MSTLPDESHATAPAGPPHTPASWLRQFIVIAIGAVLVVIGIALTITEWLVTRSVDGLTLGLIVFVAGVAFLLGGAIAGRRSTQLNAALMAVAAFLAMGLAVEVIAGEAVARDVTYTAMALAIIVGALIAFLVLLFVIERAVERRGWTMFTARGVFASVAMANVGRLMRAVGLSWAFRPSHAESVAWHLLALVALLWPQRIRAGNVAESKPQAIVPPE